MSRRPRPSEKPQEAVRRPRARSGCPRRVPRELTQGEHNGLQGLAETGGAGGVVITWVGHATALIELGGLRILTDPVLGRRAFLLRRLAPLPRPAALEEIDVVLVSHAHADHLDPRSLHRVRPAGPTFAPP